MCVFDEQYIWQKANWTEWRFDIVQLMPLLNQVYYQQGLLFGRMQQIGLVEREQIGLQTLTQSVTKTSEIEGEILNADSVRSSLARRLGIEVAALPMVDRSVEGVVEMTLDAVENFSAPLTKERLFGWHAALFPTGYSGMYKIAVGQYRQDHNGAMQVVSGIEGRQKVHFQAPPAELLSDSMAAFLDWVNNASCEPILKAAIAHLWFLTLHPFEDGNGRIARAIADFLLARAEQSSFRCYSLSAQIQQMRSEYYTVLEQTQKGILDLNDWLTWFLNCLIEAIKAAQSTFEQVLAANRYWQQWRKHSLNERQTKVLNRLLGNFEGKLSNKKYAALTKVSRDTALRDLTDLVEKGILQRAKEGGRSVNYELVPLSESV